LAAPPVGQKPYRLTNIQHPTSKILLVGIIERKVRAKEELRQTIVNAAMKIFVDEGYEKTSIRSIAEAIEYSPGTIYLYFKDKDELLFAVHEVAFSQFFVKMAPLLLISEPRARLLEMGHIYIRFAYENPELYGLMFMDKAPMNCLEVTDDAWVAGNQALDLLRTTVAQCLPNYNEYQVEIFTMMVWSTVHGLASLGIRERFCVLKDKPEYELETMLEDSIMLLLNKFLPV
jgi:AcrR family transcriptional regulator